MRYIVGIAIGENPTGKRTVAAVTCPENTVKYFGYRRLSAGTIRQCSSCCVLVTAESYLRGIAAAYQRSIEKLLIQEEFQVQRYPDITAYILKPFANKEITIPHTLAKNHWTIEVAEELLLSVGRLKSL